MNPKALLLVICIWSLLTACSSNNKLDNIVYITDTGSKYHISSCRYLGKSALPISLADACNRHYGPCSACSPPLCGVSEEIRDSVGYHQIRVDPTINYKSKEKRAVRCSGITKKGKQCKRLTKAPDGRCFQHKQ